MLKDEPVSFHINSAGQKMNPSRGVGRRIAERNSQQMQKGQKDTANDESHKQKVYDREHAVFQRFSVMHRFSPFRLIQ
ncbi:hypothetical protein D3C71_2026310 [compost metagenome]